jgi:two-component system CheB/CheR fusion protein
MNAGAVLGPNHPRQPTIARWNLTRRCVLAAVLAPTDCQLSNDLQNLLSSTDIATLFLDRTFRILRFTPRVSEIFNVRPVDRGRPLSDLTHRLGYDELQSDAETVLRTLVPVEREVRDERSRWYMTRVLPYRTSEDQIGGIVLTFVDITERKRAQEEVHQARVYAESIVETLARAAARTPPGLPRALGQSGVL